MTSPSFNCILSAHLLRFLFNVSREQTSEEYQGIGVITSHRFPVPFAELVIIANCSRLIQLILYPTSQQGDKQG